MCIRDSYTHLKWLKGQAASRSKAQIMPDISGTVTSQASATTRNQHFIRVQDVVVCVGFAV